MPPDHDTAVGLIYDAVLDPAGWHAALTAVSRLTGVQTFHLCAWNAAESRDELGIVTDASWNTALQAYNAHYAATDPRVAVCAGLGPGSLMVCSEHLSPRVVERSEIYQDHLIPAGLRYAMASVLGAADDLAYVLGLMRPADAGPWRAEEVAAARRLLPHLQRAAALSLRERALAQAQLAGAAASQLTHLALLTLAADGRVVQANARAESLLRRPCGLRLQGGRLQACGADEQAALRAALEAVARDGEPQNLRLAAAGGAGTVELTLMRAPASHTLGSSLRLVCIVAEGRPRIATAAQLIDWFGLTPAEARLVRALAHGGGIDGYAQEAGITRNTAKTQLAHAMAKIGVGDQRELVRRVLRLPAVRERRPA